MSELADKIEDLTKSFQDGFDASLIGKGMSVSTLPVSLPQPEQFAKLPIQAFAAAMGIPLRILLGNETGERASTQDIREFNDTIEARRTQQTRPLLRALIERLQACGVFRHQDIGLQWQALDALTSEQRLNRAKAMAAVNASEGTAVFSTEEIRDTAGY